MDAQIDIKAGGTKLPQVSFLLYPAFENLDELGDILNRLAWALTGFPLDQATVWIPLAGELAGGRAEQLDLPVPQSQRNYLAGSGLETRCRFISPQDAERRISEAGCIIQWNVGRCGGRLLSGAVVLDPQYRHDTEAAAAASLLSRVVERGAMRALREESRARYARLLEGAGAAPALLFLTGPSLEAALEKPLPDGRFSMICNSLVKNREFLRKIRPDLLVFLDPAYHFGVSRYAAEFREHAVAALSEYPNCACLVPEAYLPLTQAFLGPALAGRLIGMPVKLRGPFNLPTPGSFFVRQTGNVLTQLMLPVGMALANPVWVVGADGRRPPAAGQPPEKGFWAHTGSAQMGDLLATIYAAHPSLARDEDTLHYYALHCRRLERLIRLGESRFGRRVYALTPSFIPALSGRWSDPADGGLCSGFA